MLYHFNLSRQIIIKVLPKLAKGWIFLFLIYVKDESPDSDRLTSSTSNLPLLLQEIKESSKCLDGFAFVSISRGKLESLTFAVFLTIPKSSSHWREGGRERICQRGQIIRHSLQERNISEREMDSDDERMVLWGASTESSDTGIFYYSFYFCFIFLLFFLASI